MCLITRCFRISCFTSLHCDPCWNPLVTKSWLLGSDDTYPLALDGPDELWHFGTLVHWHFLLQLPPNKSLYVDPVPRAFWEWMVKIISGLCKSQVFKTLPSYFPDSRNCKNHIQRSRSLLWSMAAIFSWFFILWVPKTLLWLAKSWFMLIMQHMSFRNEWLWSFLHFIPLLDVKLGAIVWSQLPDGCWSAFPDGSSLPKVDLACLLDLLSYQTASSVALGSHDCVMWTISWMIG
jgi:hypothetical protein